jgi:hypothetical protein
VRYQLTPIHCRPWLLNGLSTRLIESHYENNYGGALRRLNAITEKLESLDFAKNRRVHAQHRLASGRGPVREVHEGRPLGLEGNRGSGKALRVD